MKTVKISEFKATCIGVLKGVAETGEPVLVTLRGKPLAKVEPVQNPEGGRVLGGLRGHLEILGDIVQSDFESDWETGEA